MFIALAASQCSLAPEERNVAVSREMFRSLGASNLLWFLVL